MTSWQLALRSCFKSFVFCFLAVFLSPDSLALTAVRPPGTDFKVVAKKLRPVGPNGSPVAFGRSAYDLAGDWSSIDSTKIPTENQLSSLFVFVRDSRDLSSSSRPSFARRISWLYPNDGCWIRAALVSQWAEKQKYVRPMKLFIFGNLNVKSSNAIGGSVSWWYHVVPVLKDYRGDVYVIDPAIDANDLMKVDDWILSMVPKKSDATLSLCSTYTYEPYDDCEMKYSGSEADAPSDIASYLAYEWQNVQDLGRDPFEELGAHPPWRKTPPP